MRLDKSIFAVVGGDARQAALANFLAREGSTVYCAGFEQSPHLLTGTASTDPLTAILMSDTVILPMPPTRDGKTLNAPLSTYRVELNEDFCEALRGKAVFVGIAGKLRDVSPSYARLNLFDYYANESYLLRNAQATAEGALAELIANVPRTICGSRMLITGCGRITRCLAPMLRSLGANVAVAARKPSDQAWVQSQGMEALTFRKAARRAKEFDIIVNTVPAPVIDERFLEGVSEHAALLDLASLPGGIDLEACEKRGIQAWRALGLPGKYAPLTAAEIIKDTVMLILEEG